MSTAISMEYIVYGFGGFLVLFGGVTAVLIKMGLINFGESSKSCEDCAAKIAEGARNENQVVIVEIEHIKTDMKEVKTNTSRLWERVDNIGDDVSYIKGWLNNNGRPGGRRSYDPK